MAKQFSPIDFFRKVPNWILAKFFQEHHGVMLQVPFEMLKETEISQIFSEFIELPEPKKSQVDAECQAIELMANQSGITALTDEANENNDNDFPLRVSEFKGFHEVAMWAFLEYPEYWEGAMLFLYAESISDYYWRKRKNLPPITAQTEEKDLNQLANSISNFFHLKEGRGKNCKVEYFQKSNKQYFFAYPEDYAQSDIEWVANALSTRSRNPAFVIIFVYCQDEGSLNTCARKNAKYKDQLEGFFAKAILNLQELEPLTKEGLVYYLDPLAWRDFRFQYEIESGIERVAICRLHLTLKGGFKKRVTVEANPNDNLYAVHDLLKILHVPPYYVNKAQIKVWFSPSPKTRSRSRRFEIGYPDSCNLRHDGRDGTIREMLVESGIEPKPPELLPDDMPA